MLEVLIRRHYREYELDHLTSTTVDGRPFAVADYLLDDRPTHLVSTIGKVSELKPGSGLVDAVTREVDAAAPGHESVVDLYLSWPEAPDTVEEESAGLRALVEQLDVIRRVRRIAIAVGAGTDRPPAYFTFRPTDDGGVVEDDLVRGVHPMVGRRLNLWRLRKFTLTRLEAPEDVLLYFAVAKENPADQRLIALAQVRQLGVVRDESGRVTSLPHVERAIANCLEAIRRARAGRGAKGARLDMNHVWLQVWPVIEAEVDQLTALQNSIAPLTAGAGIEEIRADGRVAGPNGSVTPISARFFYQAGSGVTSNVGLPATEMLKPIDDYQQKVLRARRRGTVYPYEMQGLVAGVGRVVGRVRPRRQRTARPRRPTAGTQQGRHHRRRRHDANPLAPGGSPPCGAQRRPHPGTGRGVGGGVRPDHRCARPRGGARRPGRVVRPVGRRADLDGLGHREHGLGGPRR